MLHSAQGRPTTAATSGSTAHESTMRDPSSSTSHPGHARTLPGNYDDQVAFLYHRIEELKQLFRTFIEDHDDMKTFRDLRDPLVRLAISPNVVQVSLDEFCKVVKELKPQITETFERQPGSRKAKSPAPSMYSHYVNGEKSEDPSKPVHHITVNSSKIERMSDDTKPFEFKISEKGCIRYPMTVKFHPTAPMPDTQAVPVGMSLEVNPGGHVIISELPPLIDPPRTSVSGEVTQRLDAIPTAPAPLVETSSKGKKRARDEDVDHEADIRPRSPRRAPIATKSLELDVQGSPKSEVPETLRRSTRMKAGKNSRPGSGKGKAKMTEEVDVGVGGSNLKSRGRSRKAYA